MSYLELKNVLFQYSEDVTAVENVSLSFNLGEKVAIIGQNGAGKTTLVKLMNGLLKPTKGEVYVDGASTKKFTTAQISRKVGYVFQNPDDQIFHNNIYDEVKFGPKILGFSEEKKKEMVELGLILAGIEELKNENPYNVPLALRKFITIASVIAMDTDVLIFDEPTAGQDYRGVKQLEYAINKLQSIGKTIITITHDMEFVVKNFKRVIIMANRNVLLDTHVSEAFWNLEVLDKSMLKQPAISQLARKVELGAEVLNIDQFLKEFKTNSYNNYSKRGKM